jgi:hypothetical protein
MSALWLVFKTGFLRGQEKEGHLGQRFLKEERRECEKSCGDETVFCGLLK